MKDLSVRLDEEILKTKSGDLRNLLCDANIVVKTLLEDGGSEFTEEELHFLLLSVNHFKEEMKRVNEFYISTITTLDRVSAIAVLDRIHDKIIS